MSFCVKLERIVAAAVSAAVVFSCAFAAEPTDVRSAVEAATAYKRGGAATLAEALTPGEDDWYAVAVSGEAEGYLDKLEAYVAERYAASGGLDDHKATEWHRVILAVRALGGNPESFGGANLIRDGITEPVVAPENQGVNGLMWAALAAKGSGSPEAEAEISGLCAALAARQNADGSFSLRGAGDSDLTAMAVRVFNGVAGFENNLAAARAALDAMRLPSGGFASSGAENSESAAQVVLALCELGERPDAEADVLLKYQNPDGGFAHLPGGKSNSMATAQALLALTAYERVCAAEAEQAPAEAEAVSAPAPEAAPEKPTEPASANVAEGADEPSAPQSAAEPKAEPAPEAVPAASPEVVPEEAAPTEREGPPAEAAEPVREPSAEGGQSAAPADEKPSGLPMSAIFAVVAAAAIAFAIIKLKK